MGVSEAVLFNGLAHCLAEKKFTTKKTQSVFRSSSFFTRIGWSGWLSWKINHKALVTLRHEKAYFEDVLSKRLGRDCTASCSQMEITVHEKFLDLQQDEIELSNLPENLFHHYSAIASQWKLCPHVLQKEKIKKKIAPCYLIYWWRMKNINCTIGTRKISL